MLSDANISHGIMIAIVMLISIVLLICAGIAALCRMKSKNRLVTNDMTVLMVALLGIAGVCVG